MNTTPIKWDEERLRRVTLMDALQADCPYIPQWLRELAQDHKSTWEAGSCGGWPNYREEK